VTYQAAKIADLQPVLRFLFNKHPSKVFKMRIVINVILLATFQICKAVVLRYDKDPGHFRLEKDGINPPGGFVQGDPEHPARSVWSSGMFSTVRRAREPAMQNQKLGFWQAFLPGTRVSDWSNGKFIGRSRLGLL
jgi:hypothetical protein